ncbi:MAG: hypothetical protein ACOCWG_06165 [bacterium]
MDYNEWKSSIMERYDLSESTDEFYWPENDNFTKLTEPFVNVNDNVFCCKTLGAYDDKEELESFIENSSNIGILYIVKNTTTNQYRIRVIDFDNDKLSPISVEDYYENNKKNFTGPSATTFDELKEKVNDIKYLDFIFIKRATNYNGNYNISIVKVLTDGNMIYV